MILCAGEALIDMLPRESTTGESAFAPYPGGSVFNTAIALGRLGAPTGFFSGLSNDLFGDILKTSLAASGVDASFAALSDKPTTLAFVTLIDGQASYAFYDENTAGRMLTPADLPKLNDNVNALFFGGISLVVEPCALAYEALLKREAARRVIMIDPNIRPAFIRDETAYRERVTTMMAAADIVKVSDEDLAWLTGHDDLKRAARQLIDAGSKIVCVTEGADGVTGHMAGGGVRVVANRVEVVDTVGAGDTFNAGVLAALHEAGALTKDRIGSLDDAVLRDALTLGVQAAAVTVSRAGANPPTREELQ
jgi:fructokinase